MRNVNVCEKRMNVFASNCGKCNGSMQWVKKLFSSVDGSDMLLLASIGLAAFWLLKPSRKKPIISDPTSARIESQLIAAGLSPRAAKMWRAVAQFETGNYTSNLFHTAHNLFGMKHPQRRETRSTGRTGSGFATFDSLTDSVDDLVLYMREFNYPLDFDSVEALVSFMKQKGYFEEPLSYYLPGVQVYA